MEISGTVFILHPCFLFFALSFLSQGVIGQKGSKGNQVTLRFIFSHN